jgi:hypothetical protein
MENIMIRVILGILIVISSIQGQNDKQKFSELRRFDAKEARQGVAVDKNYIYVIGTREIGKYDKLTGEFITSWNEAENGPVIHLDSGVIIEGKLYCAHSNYPGIPMTSSVEVWDAKTLEHIDSHSFGIHWGSCTWVDFYNGFWWAAFAQYDKWKSETNKGTEWTTIVKFDENWHYLNTWVFPLDVIERFRPMSNSGGSWGSDGLLYCTGHDRPELYAMQIPVSGTKLELIDIVPIDNTGQGIAWDRSEAGIIYTISKKDRQVRVFQLIE